MEGILVITVLTVQSSYAREIEQPLELDGTPDTIQWWIAPTGSWRIKTFALDHDIHTHQLSSDDDMSASKWVDLARTNAERHYGDVIASHHVVELTDCTNASDTNAVLQAAGLEPRIEVAAGRFAFWKPDDARYHTQSVPA